MELILPCVLPQVLRHMEKFKLVTVSLKTAISSSYRFSDFLLSPFIYLRPLNAYLRDYEGYYPILCFKYYNYVLFPYRRHKVWWHVLSFGLLTTLPHCNIFNNLNFYLFNLIISQEVEQGLPYFIR